jgi:hypothetical protein
LLGSSFGFDFMDLSFLFQSTGCAFWRLRQRDSVVSQMRIALQRLALQFPGFEDHGMDEANEGN